MSKRNSTNGSANRQMTTELGDITYPNDIDVDEIKTRGTAILHMPSALTDVSDLFGVGDSLSEKLTNAGFATVPDIHHTEKWKLMLIDGIGNDTARALKSLSSSRCDYHFGEYAWEPFKKYEPEIARGVRK